MLPPDIDERLESVSALQDPVRRALYLYVLSQRDVVSRDAAANAVGVRRGLAAFHLDRLAAEGLLEIEFRRLSGRSGPGAGRPSKLYRPVLDEREITLPPRSYVLAADLLAEAVEAAGPDGTGESPDELAERRGIEMGQGFAEELGSRPSTAKRKEALTEALATCGYQPYGEGQEIRLRNCPFHALSSRHTELVCGMNKALLSGVLAGLDVSGLEAALTPTSGECCVTIQPAKTNRKS